MKSLTSIAYKIMTAFMIVMLVLTGMPVTPVSAASTANQYPANWANAGTAWTNQNNGRLSDNARATANNQNYGITFSNFGFTVPAGAVISGIEVNIEAYSTTVFGLGQRNVTVAISPDGGTTWAPNTYPTAGLPTGADGNSLLGGTANTWNRAWTVAEVNSANFTVRLVSGAGLGTFNLDSVFVRVTYMLPSTTALVSSLNPSNTGDSVTFTATVTGTAGTPTGNVIFRDGATVLGTVALDASGVATYTTIALLGGSHSITATYNGNATYAASNAALTQGVNQAPAFTSAAATTFTVGAAGTFTVNVAGSPIPGIVRTGTLPGGVTFTDNGNGTGTLSGTPTVAGTYNLVFTATNSQGVATQNFVLTVVRGNQLITFASPPTPADVNTTYTINPSASSGLPVTVVASGACTIAGNVVSYTSVGTCTLTASQGGNANWNAAPNVGNTVQVRPATTTTTITSSVNPSVLGQNVIFTVRVNSAAGTPTGSVTISSCEWVLIFCVGGTNQTWGTYPLVGGVATINKADLPVARYGGNIVPSHITVTYNPTGIFASSNTTLDQTVNTANTAVALTSSINPSFYLQPVTFTATVTVLSPGAGTVNGGTITLYEGATVLGTGTVNASGVISFTISNLARGTHPITAHFVGTDDFGTSTSPTLNQIVRRDSDIALTSSLNPSVYGNTVTFTATVTDPVAAGTPTGTVSFYDGLTLLGTSNLNGSAVATFNTSLLSAGSHNITATYNGNTFYVASTSLIVVQTVTPAMLTVTAENKSTIYGDANVTFTYAFSGFVNGQTLATSDVTGTPVCTTTATNASPVGTYPITCTTGSLVSNNYAFNFVDGTLTVTPKALTITAINQGKTYGMVLTLTGTEFYYVGLINSDIVDTVTLTCPQAANPVAPAGDYPIVPSAAVGIGLSNYTITYVNGTLHVGGNILVITADNQTKTYGQTFTFNGTEFTAVGLQGSDTLTSVTLSSLGVSANAPVSTYAIMPSAAVGTGLSNYFIVYQAGQLDVNQALLTFDPGSHTKLYGDTFTGYTGAFTGLFAFDSAVVTPVYDSPGEPPTATVTAPGPSYPINVTFTDPNNRLANYILTLDPAPAATLTVLPRTLTVTPTNRSKPYGDTLTSTDFSGTITGIQNGDNITATYDSQFGDPATAAVGTYNINATLSDPDGMLGNYTLVNNIGTLTVTRRDLVVTSDSQFKLYGDVFSAFTGSVVGLQNGDVITPNYASAGAPALAAVGTYNITVLPLNDPGGNLGNYNITYNIGTLAVGRRTLSVTPEDKSKIYGDTFSAFTGVVTGLQNGDAITPIYSSQGAIATATVGTYPITVTLNDPGGKLGNYDFTLGTGTLTVTKRDLLVTSDDKYKDYGTWFIAFTGSINGIQNGENISANYASAGSPPAAAVGPYPITITLNDPTGKLGNYNVILTPGTLTVGSSVLTVTALNQTIPYGSPDPAFTFTYSGFASGDTAAVIDTPPTCTVTTTPHTDIGTYPIVCSGGVDNAYTFVYVPGTLTVTKRTLVVTPADKIKTYGSVFSAFTGAITGIQNGENITASYTSLGAPATAAVGIYDINATLIDPDGRLVNYTVVYNIGKLTVDPRNLVVSPDNKTKIYGDTFSAYTSIINGLQNADTVVVNYTSAGEPASATVSAPGPTYPITVTLTDPGNILSNYTVTLNTATLTVTRRPLIVTPDNKAKVFGTTFTAFTGTVVGLQAGDNITETYASTGAPAAAPAGSYPITVTLADPANKLPNYLVTLNQGILTVGTNILTVTANNQTKIYGDPDPVFTFTYAGFQGSDTAAVLTTQPTCQVSVAHNGVGTFPITCAGGVDDNYIFTYTPGTLTINPRAVVVTPDNKTKVYGDTFTAFTGTVTGLQARDNITVTYASAGAPATATVTGSPYLITATLVDPDNRLSNYTVTLNTGLLTVTQRTLTVTPDNKNKVYGSAFTDFTGTAVGLQGGDSITVTYASAGSPATAPVGTYPIAATLGDPGGILANYAVTLNTGTLTVTPRDLVVTPADKLKIYGDVFTAYTGAIVGIQNGDAITATYTSLGAPSPALIGDYDITATLNAPVGVLLNYNVTLNIGTLTVTRRTLIVTPDDKGKPFGVNFTAFTGTVVGLRVGDNITPVYASTGAPAAAPSGTYPITVTLTDPGNLLANYIVTLHTGTLTVGANVLTVTANNQTIVYGAADPLFTFTYAGFQAGDTFAVLTTQPTCQVTVAHNNIGTYPITCSGGVDDNYIFSYTPATLTVTSRALVVTPANKTKVYGDTFTAFTGTITGALGADSITVNYDSNGAPAAAVVGPYAITATLDDPFNRLGNYTVTLNTGTLTVTPHTLTATPDDKNKVYGTIFTAFTGSVVGIQNGDNITATYASTGAPAAAATGPYPITVMLNDPGNKLSNYTVTLNTGTLTVGQYTLIVTPADKLKIYGNAFSAFTGTVVGVQPGDNITVTYASTGAAATAAIGDYNITATLSAPAGVLNNYTVILNIGTLTVTPRTLVVTPDNKAKVFGTVFNAFTGNITGIQNGDNITATYASTGAPAAAAVGIYPITATLNAPAGVLANYAVTYNTGTLAVGLTVLTITADNQTMIYGDPEPVYTFAYAGFAGSDTPAVIDTPPTCQVAVPHNAVGTYPITCSGGIDNSYSFTYVSGTLTVTARDLVVRPVNKTKVYGDLFTAFTGTVTGLQAADNITVIYDSTGAPAAAAVGTYPITVTLDDPNGRLTNYTSNLNTGTLTVTQRPLVATPDDKNKVYGTVFTAYTGSIVGIQNGDVITPVYDSLGAPATAASGTYPITVTLNALPAVLANYSITLNTGTLTVGGNTLVITPADKTKVYGDVFAAFTGTVVGLQPGDNITATYTSTGAAGNAAIGDYPITVILNDPDNKLPNYTVILNTGTLTVTRRALIVTPDNKAKAFGTLFNAFTGTVVGLQAGDIITPTYASTGAPAAAVAGIYPITVTLADPGNRLPNYTVTLNTGTLTVGTNVLTVTANNQTKLYGNPDPIFTFTYAGFQSGDTAAVLDTLPTCQVAVPHNAVGTFPITCSGGIDNNYVFSYTPGTLTITPRALSVTPDNKSKIYGDIFAAYTGTTTGIQAADNITAIYASAGAPAAAAVGAYPITVTLDDPLNRLSNYTVTLNTGTLTVTPRPLTVTPDDKNKVYGTVFTAFTGNVVGIQAGDGITVTYASAGAPAAAASGTYPITATLNDPNNRLANYAVTLNTGTLTVGGNTLVVTPADKTKIYGDVFAAFTGTVVGLQPGDNITATYTSAGAAGNAIIGDYPITVTLNDPGNKLPNYTVILNTGTLTVTPRALIVTPDNKAKVFGTNFNAFTGTVVGLQAGDIITPTYASTGAPAAAVAGIYPITVTLADPGNKLPNYTVTLNTGTLTVGTNVLTVTANNQTMVYGNPEPAYTFTYSGFLGSDTAAVLDTLPTCQVSVPHNAVGTFPITCSGGIDNNYVFSYTPGTLTVTPRALTVTPANKTKVYGDTFTAFTGAVVGLQVGDNVTVTYGSAGASAVAAIGIYPLTVTLNDPNNRLGNYTVTLNTGTLTVTQRPLVVTPDDKNKVYGTLFTTFTGNVVGVQNGDAITPVYASLGSPAAATSGTYPITVTLNALPSVLANYSITLNTGTLTVGGNTLIVTPADKTKIYGSTFAAFTGTIVGLQPGDNITATYSSAGAAATAIVGNHSITVTLNDPGNKLTNYTVVLNTGTLSVTPRSLLVIPDNKTKLAGTLFTAFTGTVTGVQTGDNITATYDSIGAPAAAVPGIYLITAALNDPNNRLPNYIVTISNTSTLTVSLASQTITVTTPAPASAANNSTFTVAATASSGLDVEYSATGSCTNVGANFTMTSATGTCVVHYNQPGNESYGPAQQVIEAVAALINSQTITVTTPAPAFAAFGNSFNVAATASSGLTVSITASGVCTIVDHADGTATIRMVASDGTCEIHYNQAGNGSYSAAPQITESTAVDSSAPTVTINQETTQADPTNVSPINFTVVFSESVTGFTGADITLTGTANATTAVVTEIAPNDGTTYTVAVSGMKTDGTVIVSIPAGAAKDTAGNNSFASSSTDNTVTYFDAIGPTVQLINTNPDTGDGALKESEKVSIKVTLFKVTFDQGVYDPADSDSGINDVTNPSNYMLIRDLGDTAGFQTVSCSAGAAIQDQDDTSIAIGTVTYDSATHTATFTVNGGLPLSNGNYRLFICGTTSIVDPLDTTLKLVGSSGPSSDYLRNFTVNIAGGGGGGGGGGGDDKDDTYRPSNPVLIPVTGFAPNKVTVLPIQPANKAYKPLDEIRIEIPTLGIDFPIVGVSLSGNNWNLTWLKDSVGYLEGSAYPTFSGNTVLTAHVIDANNNLGPFSDIKGMHLGDKIYLHAYGKIYVYEVQENRKLSPANISTVFKHHEYNWVTLVTCEEYDAKTGVYKYRRMVRAVLISVVPEE